MSLRSWNDSMSAFRELAAEVGSLADDPAGGGVGLAFRDPDGIQLEFYADIQERP